MASSSVYLPGPAEARSHHHHSMHRRSLAQHRLPSYDGLQQYPPGLGYHPDPSYYPHELDYSTSTSASAVRLGVDLAPGYDDDDDGAYVRHRHRQHHQHRQPCPWHQLPVQSSWQSEPQPTWVHHPTHDTAGGEDLLPPARVLEYSERLARVAYGLYQSTTTSTTPARRDSLVTSSSPDSTSASSSSTHNATTTTTLSSPSSPSSPSLSPTLSTSPSTSLARHVKKLPPARRSKHKPPTTQRSCAQCSATKSPTWRRGPSGLTLCNGCGLRYGQAKKTSRSMAIDSILN